MHMVATCAAIDDGPSAVRFPRGEGMGVALPDKGVPLEIGRGRIVREGNAIALLSLGARLGECLKAAQELAAYGLSTTVADARFAKPLDTALIKRLAREHEVLITIEEGAIGGFGSQVLHHLAMSGMLDHGLKIRTMVLPDRFSTMTARRRNTTRPGSTPAISWRWRWPRSAAKLPSSRRGLKYFLPQSRSAHALTRLTAFAPLSRNAGEGGPGPKGWVGEGSAVR